MKPHDEIFREMVSDPEAQRDMIRVCLPDLAGRIDLDSVTAVDATFTGGKQADLLLSMRERGDGERRGRKHLVYMLVEHKSYHDPLVPTQLFRYMGAIWHQQWELRESNLRGPLPLIHPVVLYHGERPWTTPLELTGQHEAGDSDTVPFVTDLVYRLVDLSTIEPERLRVATRTLAYLITLRHVFRRLEQPTARQLVETLGMLSIGAKTRIRLFEYLLFSMPDENTELLVTELEEREYTMEGGEAIMTVAQELRRQGREEGLRYGREEGLKDGREEATHEVARRMLAKGATVDFVVETTGLTAEQVAALRNDEKE